MDIPHFVNLLVDGHLGCFQYGNIMSHAAESICIQVFESCYTEKTLHQENSGRSRKPCARDRKDRNVAMRTDSSKMTDVESGVANFASSARAGRRNALPDIQSSAATDGTSDLPLKLEALSVKEDAKEKDEETTQDQLEKPQNEEK
ncbi:cAMP-dependent protein kinase inhibitor beta isoform X2 [Macaca fascicularis]|uniref:cAMP-dependent protein kinase inhibitor beta isoform X2 n=1 Tax=Macaca fascicularis TaxID=9541 RepID=UPI001E252DE0|nr:cAMP-dependent protein kinase inhibitor beta isoform X1 [Macaca fascicularis]